MDRRKFFSVTGASAAAIAAGSIAGTDVADAQPRPGGKLPPLKVRLGHDDFQRMN